MNQFPMRDDFIRVVHAHAKEDPRIIFLSADLGAEALDAFRSESPSQFLHMGISEQNAVDVAAGLALDGFNVFLYAMAPFITFRCFEQIKVALASMNVPATIVGVGVGYGYDDAGPTHYATEDISCMRSLANIEILNPADSESVKATAELCCSNRKLRYIRLDRKHLPNLYDSKSVATLADHGAFELRTGKQVAILSTGYMTHTALSCAEALKDKGIEAGVIDIFRIKPLDPKTLLPLLEKYTSIVTLEEHFLSGGLGSAIVETLADNLFQKPIRRIGVKDHYYYENGGREHVLQLAGLDSSSVGAAILAFLAEQGVSHV